MRKRFYGIERIVDNVKTLSNPVAQECFFYECEDYSGLASVVDEIDELRECLPEGINISDLPHTYCGNKKTKVVGLGTCDATQGHKLLIPNAEGRVIFKDYEEAKTLGYRPCKRCMYRAYLEWEKDNGQ